MRFGALRLERSEAACDLLVACCHVGLRAVHARPGLASLPPCGPGLTLLHQGDIDGWFFCCGFLPVVVVHLPCCQ